MNVIRMIKVFGWEKHIDGKISAKREEELAYQRKRVILEIISNILKCVRRDWLWGEDADDSVVSPSPSSL